MMARGALGRRELFEQYGRDEEGALYMVCPTCTEPERKFDTLEQWKDHMQREHGGYTVSEVAAGQPTEGGGGEHREPAPSLPPKTKKLSARSRELNDKLNRCISLVIKHLISGISEEERTELETKRTEIQEAIVGIQLDFEERMFQLSGFWAATLVLGLLYALPAIPSMKEAIAKAKERARQKKEKTP